MARVYSLWIFDRHCNPIYHQDWAHLHPTSSASGVGSSPVSSSPSQPSGLASIGATLQRAIGTGAASLLSDKRNSLPPVRPGQPSLPGITRLGASSSQTQQSSQVPQTPSQAQAARKAEQRSSAGSQIGSSTPVASNPSDPLPFDEEAKLVYGVVFSLRNMVRKLGGNSETFNSYTTSTYTLAHLHTPTMYTFVILTDPVPPPSTIPSRSNDGYSIGTAHPASTASSTRSGFGTGGGIPGTGGMSLKGVLMQIYRGPWLDCVIRNPLIRGLEREERIVDPNDDDESDEEDSQSTDHPEKTEKANLRSVKVIQDTKLERLEGVDTDAFREGIEKVLAQNKLSAPVS